MASLKFPESDHPNKYSLLIVEDDPQYHLLYKVWFEPTYRLVIVSSFAAAIAPLMNEHPAIVITDLRLEDPLEQENYHGRHVVLLANALSIPTIVVSGFLTDVLRSQLPIYYAVSYVLDKVPPAGELPFSEKLKASVQDLITKYGGSAYLALGGQVPDNGLRELVQTQVWQSSHKLLSFAIECVEQVTNTINFNFDQRVRASGRTEDNLDWLQSRTSDLRRRFEAIKTQIMMAHSDQDLIPLTLAVKQECTQWKANFS